MQTPHTETVVEKAVAYVKDVFGIHTADPAPDVEAKPEYHDTTPGITAENAVRPDPNVFTVNSRGQTDAGSYIAPLKDTDAERLRRAVDEFDQVKTVKLNPESGRVVEDIASADALRPDPDAFPTKSVAEVNDEIVRRENGI